VLNARVRRKTVAAALQARRRRLLGAFAALVPAVIARPAMPAQRDVINVKSLGASGNGKSSDLGPIREAVERAADRGRPTTILFPRGEYFLGTARESILVSAERLTGLRLVGEGATITCRSLSGSSTMVELVGCREAAIEGISFKDHGLDREADWLGAAAIRLSNAGTIGCENVSISGCTFDSVLAAIVCRRTEDNLRIRTRGIRLDRLTVRRSYYGLSFQDNGDHVIGRNLRFDDVKRSYFPFGVSDHDVEIDTANNATGYTDVLIKCYHADTQRIRAAVKCRAKRGGDAIVALDQQHEQGRGLIRDIDLRLDIDDVDCRLETVVLIRSLDQKGNTEKRTRNRWDNIGLDGTVRACASTKLIDIPTLAATPGTLRIGRTLAANPRLPRAFPGFHVTGL
jgi:hypothetical protein